MDSKEESWSDWVQLNYQNSDNKRIKPITYKFPQYILDEWARIAARQRVGQMVVMYSQLRRKFNARTGRR